MERGSLKVLAVLLVCTPMSSTAYARDCVSGEAPPAYVIGTCGGSIILPDICTATGSPSSVGCDISQNGHTSGADVNLETRNGSAPTVLSRGSTRGGDSA